MSNNTIVSYTGPFTINILTFFGNYLDKFLKAESTTLKKVYKIYFELTQNVAYYSANRADIDGALHGGIGTFSLSGYDSYFVLTTNNLINKDHAPVLQKNCQEINSLCHSDLRKLKRITRNMTDGKDHGAHIGLIIVSLLSGNEIDYSIEEVDEIHASFTIGIKINRNYI